MSGADRAAQDAHLVVLAGLPGTGKSTIADGLARRLRAVHLRIDAIEQRLRGWEIEDIGPLGYLAACGAAETNLRLGHVVIIDCVNPWPLTRAQFLDVAGDLGAPATGVELVCDDVAEHRRRVETRTSDVVGLALPDWAAVRARDYRPWNDADLRVDTTSASVDESVDRIATLIDRPR